MQRRIMKDMLAYLPAKALPALAAFITVPIYTRLFPPNEFGNYVLATAAAEFLLLVAVEGLGQGAIRFYSAFKNRSGLSGYFAVVFGSVALVTAGVTALCACILVFIRSQVSSELYPLLWAALALFAVSACFITLTNILRGQEKSVWYSVSMIGASFGGILFGLLFVLAYGMNIDGLIWGQTLGLLLPIFPLIWLTTRSISVHPAHLNKPDFKQVWAFALPFTVANIAFWTLTLADRYIVELYRGTYEVGLYAVAGKISSRSILLLVSLFILVPVPIVSRLWEERGRQDTEEALTEFTRMLFLMVIPAVVGLTVIAAPIVRLLADEAYFEGYRAIWLVACASFALGLSELGRTGCLVSNHTGLIARNQCLAAGAGLLLNFILVPEFGFMGAAWSSVFAFSFLVALHAFTSARYLTWRWPLKSLWRVMVASAGMAVLVLLVQGTLPSGTLVWQVVNILISIVAGALVYGLILQALGEISLAHLMDFFKAERRSTTSQVAGETGHR